jgi:hypothetical protein
VDLRPGVITLQVYTGDAAPEIGEKAVTPENVRNIVEAT